MAERLGRSAWLRLGLGLGALFLGVAFLTLHEWRDGRLERSTPATRSGDEPHYLIVLHSLLDDGDLALADEYEAVAAGGPQAGRHFRGVYLDRHTILVDPETGRNERWSTIWDLGRRTPCDEPGCTPFAQLRPHGFEDLGRVLERPAHPPAFPALLAAALLPFSPLPEQVERLAGHVLLLAGFATLAATAGLALRIGLGPGSALLAAALLGLASPWLVYVRSFFTEGAAALPLVLGLWALVAGQPLLAGLAAVVAFWMRPALVVAGAGFLLERLWARDWRGAAKLAGVLGAGGIAHLVFHQLAIGRPLLSGTQAWRRPEGLDSLWGTLLDLRYGLLVFAPWVGVALFGLVRRGGRRAPAASFQRAWAIPCALCWVLLGSYGALGGTCYGPRYWIPFLPWLAVATVAAACAGGRRLRVATVVLAALTSLLVVSSALQYREVFDGKPYEGMKRWVRAARS